MDKRHRRALIASRVHLPEPTAASQRWDAVERALLESGFSIEVLTSRYCNNRSSKTEKCSIKRWPTLRDGAGNIRGYLQYLSFDVPLFFRILLTERPDIVLVEPPPTTGLAARAACSIRGLPYIWYAADTWSSGARSMGAPEIVVRLLERAERAAVSGATAVVAVTEGVERRVREMGAKQVFLVPNGIDTNVYKQYSQEPNGKTPRMPYFVYGGTASEFQGAEIFMDAFEILLREYPAVRLIFAGSGSEWPSLCRHADTINASFGADEPRVIMRDSLPPEEVAPLLSGALGALVSLVPTHNADQPYPTKILAALACGTPVVFLGTGRARDDIQSNRLGLVGDYDLEVAVSAMRELLENSNSYRSEELRRWVVDNRSTDQTGLGVLETVRYVLEKWAQPRLLIASRVFPPDPGAAAARLQMLTNKLASRFREITVLTTKPHRDSSISFPGNVSVRRAPVLRAPDGSVRGYAEYLSFDIPLFFRLLFGPKADVVLCEPPPTTGLVVRAATALRRSPYVYYAGDLLSDATEAAKVSGAIVRGVRFIESLAMKGARRVVTVNDRVARRIREVAKIKAEVVTPGIEVPGAKELRAKPDGWPSGDGPVYVYAGTVTDWMGVRLFVAAAPAVLRCFPNAKIVFIGGGMGWSELEEHVRSLEDPRIKAIASVSLSEAVKWQANATACLASLLPGPYDLAYTTKALSSWAAGTPVVYAGVGPAADDTRAHDLGLVAETNPESVAECMIEIARIRLNDPARFTRPRLRAWVRENHGAERWSKRMSDLLMESTDCAVRRNAFRQ